MQKPVVITTYLSKGGVAKSTLVALMGAYLAGQGFRVVIIDLDRQGSQSAIFDLLDGEGRGGEVLHQVLKRQVDILTACTPVNPAVIPQYGGILGSLAVVQGGALTEIAIDEIRSNPVRYKLVNTLDILRVPISQLAGHADYVLIDMGPSDQVTAVAGLISTDHLIIPTTMDFLSVVRVAPVLEEVEVARMEKSDLNVLGIVPVMTRHYTGLIGKSSNNFKTGQEVLTSNYSDLLFRDANGTVDIPFRDEWNSVMWTGETLLTAKGADRKAKADAQRFLMAVAQRLTVGVMAHG